MIKTSIIAVASLSAAAVAGTPLSFDLYTGDADPGVVPGESFSVEIDANQSENWVDFTFAMDISQGVGTITAIWFESGADGLGAAEIVGSHDGANFQFNGSGGPNPAGANGELDWNGTLARLSRANGRGGAANGIDPGEWLTIRFATLDGFFDDGLNSFLSGQSRIAFHLQSISRNDDGSAHYVSTGGPNSGSSVTIPLPSAGLMAGAALGVASLRRRR